jgi:hypothetical protein
MTDFGWGIYLTQQAAGNRPTEIESPRVHLGAALLYLGMERARW